MKLYSPHTLATQFQMMSRQDLESLASDIKAIGLRNPILIFEGMILDGRNRYEACTLSGVDPKFEDFKGNEEEARQLVISENFHRRHLTPGQKAAFCVRYRVNVYDKDPSVRVKRLKSRTNEYNPLHVIAKRFGVAPQSVDHAWYIYQNDRAQFKIVESGAKPLNQARNYVRSIKGVHPRPQLKYVPPAHIEGTDSALNILDRMGRTGWNMVLDKISGMGFTACFYREGSPRPGVGCAYYPTLARAISTEANRAVKNEPKILEVA